MVFTLSLALGFSVRVALVEALAALHPLWITTVLLLPANPAGQWFPHAPVGFFTVDSRS